MNQPPSIPDVLIRRGLPAALEIFNQAREQVIRASLRSRKEPGALLNKAREIVARYEPLFASTMKDSLLLSWLEAAKRTVDGALQTTSPPGATVTPLVSPIETIPPFAPPIRTFRPGDPEPVVHFPQIDFAVQALQKKKILTQSDFNALDQDARRAAFTVARLTSANAVAKVQEAIVADLQEGMDLPAFREKIESAVNGVLSPSQVEAVFRTETGRAYASGQISIMENPIVQDVFPFARYSATHDSRTRPQHLALEKCGLEGTDIYWADDPTIRRFWPPWSWNCRCVAWLQSVRDAARNGLKLAQRWLDTGKMPEKRFVKPPNFGYPKGWIPVAPEISAAA